LELSSFSKNLSLMLKSKQLTEFKNHAVSVVPRKFDILILTVRTVVIISI
jgi:hypothetical protein